VRRRDFITFVGGAAVVWPLELHVDHAATPVVGFLSGRHGPSQVLDPKRPIREANMGNDPGTVYLPLVVKRLT
jgi:hypothetical protein